MVVKEVAAGTQHRHSLPFLLHIINIVFPSAVEIKISMHLILFSHVPQMHEKVRLE